MPTVIFNQQKEINDLRAEIAQLREDLKVQSNAVWILDQCRDTEVSHLRKTHQQAETAAKTLDSEREANALLTAENERLREALEKISALRPKPIGDSGFQQGPRLLLDQCQEIARAALAEKEST